MLLQGPCSCCLQLPACPQPLSLQSSRAERGNPQAVPVARMLRAHTSQPQESKSSLISLSLSLVIDFFFFFFFMILSEVTRCDMYTFTA